MAKITVQNSDISIVRYNTDFNRTEFGTIKNASGSNNMK